MNKWRSDQCTEECGKTVHRSRMDKFLAYFDKEWVKNHPNWYEGFAKGIPSTNNALESCNKWYKIQLVGSSRWPLSRFLTIFKESIIGELTKRCKLDGEQWRTTPIISPKCWTDAWNQSRSKSYKWLETQLCGE